MTPSKSLKSTGCLFLRLLLILCSCVGGGGALKPARSQRQAEYDRPELVVQTTEGAVRGLTLTAATGRQVDAWLGIPFAKPPLGDLRFRHPQPMEAWEGVRDAKTLPNSCWQVKDTFFGDFRGSTMWNANTPRSEDCLYLNVVRPRPQPLRPAAVLFWIYGGGFYSGTSTLDVYDPKILVAEEDVVVVSIQYRVGSLGYLYLDTPEAPGNAGMFDQLMALRWVRRNIANFGGNPENITLFGESAGSASVSMHLLSPLSRSLFSQAVLQSGSATNPWAVIDHREAQLRGRRLAEAIQCPRVDDGAEAILQCLREADPKQLVYSELFTTGICEFTFVPIIDGTFLVEHPDISLKNGNFKQTKLLVGSVTEEANFFLVYFLIDIFKLDEDISINRKQYLDSVSQLNPYFTNVARKSISFEYTNWVNPENSNAILKGIDKMVGDYQFLCGVVDFADAFASKSNEVFMYQFGQRAASSPWPRWMGTIHGDEIAYVFGIPLNSRQGFSSEDAVLSKKMMRYWANFAKTGNPNRGSANLWTTDHWPRYQLFDKKYLPLMANDSVPRLGLRAKQCAFWKRFLPQLNSATVKSPVNSEPTCSSSSALVSNALAVVVTAVLLTMHHLLKP
nr:acetylcholine esterase-like protein [Parasacculina yatsui]